MISITELKSKFLAIFRLMRDTGMHVDFHQRGHVYRLTVEDLGYKIDRKYKRKKYNESIKQGSCPVCKKLMMNDICMNPGCPGPTDP